VDDVGGLLLSRLNASTRQLHSHIDEPWLGLLRPDVGLSDYLAVMVRTYGLVAPFESACKYTPGLEQYIDLRHMTRAGLIAQDLIALGLTPAQVSTIETCPAITMFISLHEAVGWLYVIERSTLLQQGVRRHLLHHVPQVQYASSFLASYDDGHWAMFGQVVNAAGTNMEALHEIVSASLSAFEIASRWLKNAE
jgi:heme oxygenase